MKRLGPLAFVCWVCFGCAPTGEDTSATASEAAAQVERPAARAPLAGDMGGGASNAVEELLADEIEPPAENEVLTRLRAAVEQTPDDPEAQRRLGLALRSVNRVEEALEHAERAAELGPDDPLVLFSLGIVYSAARRLQDADAAYKRMLEIAPDHAQALNNLGNVALRRGDEDGAIAWYRRAVEVEPGYIQARHKLAGVLKYYGHLEQAYETYETIVKMTSGDPRGMQLQMDSLYNMGAINLAWHKPELAEEQLARVVLTIPGHRFAHYARGQALLELGRSDEAQQELQTHLRVLHASGEGM